MEQYTNHQNIFLQGKIGCGCLNCIRIKPGGLTSKTRNFISPSKYGGVRIGRLMMVDGLMLCHGRKWQCVKTLYPW